MSYHYTDGYLTFIGSLCSVANGAGRITWGRLYESVPFKKLYTMLLLGQTFLTITLRFVAGYEPLFGLWVCSTLFFTGGNFTIFPPFSVSVFGIKYLIHT
jgi:hypothetical protein